MTIIYVLIAVYLAVCFVLGVVKYIQDNKPHPYNVQLVTDESEDETQAERITLLDETIVKYQRLLDTLTAQYKNTYNENDKAKILSKQISTMEKLNRALEKRERLG